MQLRKLHKEEALLKKRMVAEGGAGATAQLSTPNPFLAEASNMEAEKLFGGGALAQPLSPQKLQEMQESAQRLASNDVETVLLAASQFRQMLSVEENAPIAEVISLGVVPRFVAMLRCVDRPLLQIDACWVLTNIAAGTAQQTRVVVEAGALPGLVALLRSSNEDVRESAVWALGNIGADCPTFRDLILQSGAVLPIMDSVDRTGRSSMMRNGIWVLSNLCRGDPPAPVEWILPTLTCFNAHLTCPDEEILEKACWALSFFSHGSNDRISAVLQSGACQRLIELLGHRSPEVQTPALRTVGNLLAGDDQQSQAVLQCGALPALSALLESPRKALRKESCWAISNIIVGSRPIIQEVMNCGLMDRILALLETPDFEVKQEAAWVVFNAAGHGSPEQVRWLVEHGSVQRLGSLLNTATEQRILGVVLDTLELMLKVGEQFAENGENHIVVLLEQIGGTRSLEKLQEDASEEIYQKIVRLLERYCQIDDGQSCEVQTAEQGFGCAMPQGGFQFGPSVRGLA